YVLARSASLAGIPVRERYFFFRNINAIKVELDFDFTGDSVGYFWLDETKINVYYPTMGSDIYHDIAFGYVSAREQRPLLVPNWLYCGGLAYVNRGTVKHWVRDGVIANVLAWGGRAFSNRFEFDTWTYRMKYDIQLYGKQRVEYILLPRGRFDGNSIVRDVADMTSPVFIVRGKGERSFWEATDKDLAVTAVYEDGGKMWARGYRLPSDRNSKYRNWEIFNSPVADLT
ncbi:MAG: hypothetical protein ACREQ5_11235, partial [Candidatus Dormibacteria bacterium]